MKTKRSERNAARRKKTRFHGALSVGIGITQQHCDIPDLSGSKIFPLRLQKPARPLTTAAILPCAMLLSGVAALLVDGVRDDIEISDVGIVLGSKVMPDGQPSARLRARLDQAAALYQRGMFRHIIVSGGLGKEAYSEAMTMADHLTLHGHVPRASIILDENGDTTSDTARNAAATMRSRGYTSALVITQHFHVSRTRYAPRREGIAVIHSAHAHDVEARDVYSIARELVALPAYWLRASLPSRDWDQRKQGRVEPADAE